MKYFLFLFFLVPLSFSCGKPTSDSLEDPDLNPTGEESAVVQAVSVSGSANAYTFSVELKSPDTGCDQYADWWEVLGEDGSLKFRRILTHSHVNEQPFTRSGGPVNIGSSETVWIRGHMNNKGYGTAVFKGSVDAGFTKATLEVEFAKEAAKQEPLPGKCQF